MQEIGELLNTYLEPGELFDGDRFVVEKPLGAGGMARVYLARDTQLDRMVALKLLAPELASSFLAVKRFKNEAKALSLLNHGNIVKVLSFGVAGGQPYLVMEHVRGKTLDDLIAAGQVRTAKEFWAIFTPVLDAMAYAHANNIVHRDLKPANIMLVEDAQDETKNTVKILDFGIAKVVADGQENTNSVSQTSTGDTRTTGLIGSPPYMSPEQCRGEQAGAASDIYSLACVMYEYFTGKPPFSGNNALEIMYEHLHGSIPSLSQEVTIDGLNPGMASVIAQAMAKSPAERPPSMLAFKQALQNGKYTRRTRTNNLQWKNVASVLLLAGAAGIAARALFPPAKPDFSIPEKTHKAANKGLSFDACYNEADHQYEYVINHYAGPALDAEVRKCEELFLKALAIARKDSAHVEPQRLWSVLNRLGTINSSRGEPGRAIVFARQAIAVFDKDKEIGKDARLQTSVYLSSLQFTDDPDHKAARQTVEDAIKEYLSFGDTSEYLAQAYRQAADCCANYPAQQRYYLNKALEVHNHCGNLWHGDNAILCRISLLTLEWKQGDKARAARQMKELEKEIELNARKQDAVQDYVDLVNGYVAMKDLIAARRSLQRVQKLVPQPAAGWEIDVTNQSLENVRKLEAEVTGAR